MYRMPQPKFAVPPSGSISSIFPQKQSSGMTEKIDFGKHAIETVSNLHGKVSQLVSLEPSQQMNQSEAKQMTSEFETLVREKLGKIDEILIALKDRQTGSQGSLPTPSLAASTGSLPTPVMQQGGVPFTPFGSTEKNNFIDPNSLSQYANNSGIPMGVIYNQPITASSVFEKPQEPSEKVARQKKTYFNITDTMWGDLKSKYPEMPDDYRLKTFSDGSDFYAEIKNKKVKLDNKGLLKLLNQKK